MPAPPRTAPPETARSGRPRRTGLLLASAALVDCGIHRYAVRGRPVARVLDDERRPPAVRVVGGSTNYPAVGGLDAPLAAKGAHLVVAPADGQAPQTVTPGQPLDFGNTLPPAVGSWTAAS